MKKPLHAASMKKICINMELTIFEGPFDPHIGCQKKLSHKREEKKCTEMKMTK